MGTELDEECGKVLTGELPLEGTRRGFPVVLKIQEAFGDGVEIISRCAPFVTTNLSDGDQDE
jgi:hypothetical protein